MEIYRCGVFETLNINAQRKNPSGLLQNMFGKEYTLCNVSKVLMFDVALNLIKEQNAYYIEKVN